MSAGLQGASPNARFLIGDVPEGEHQKLRVGNAMSVSLLSHILGFFIIAFVMSLPSPPPSPPPTFNMPRDIVWVAQEGPGGGGGGGGNRTPEPPRKAELPGKEKITVPVVKPPKPDPTPPKPDEPPPQMNIPAQRMETGVQELPGSIANLPALPTSQGPGNGGGAGTGEGTGIGPGKGSGLGPGEGGGTGGGFYRPGNGVTSPRLIQEFKPGYTSEAMRAKIQGVVLMEAVVNVDGSVGNVHITRSLDPTFGLDQEAIKTVKKWRFAPGTRFGQAVPVLVEIEMTFTLR
jgi:periplasmic protein TonB